MHNNVVIFVVHEKKKKKVYAQMRLTQSNTLKYQNTWLRYKFSVL